MNIIEQIWFSTYLFLLYHLQHRENLLVRIHRLNQEYQVVLFHRNIKCIVNFSYTNCSNEIFSNWDIYRRFHCNRPHHAYQQLLGFLEHQAIQRYLNIETTNSIKITIFRFDIMMRNLSSSCNRFVSEKWKFDFPLENWD